MSRSLRRRLRPIVRWLICRVARPLPEIDTTSCVVLAPHPDDESLGCGGTIARKRAAGSAVTIVIATDGERSDRESRPTPEIARVRREEACAAAAQLGVDAASVVFLGLPDGALETCCDELRGLVSEVLETKRPVQVFVCSGADNHPDHRALNRAAREAAGPLRVAVLEYPVWAWISQPLAFAAGNDVKPGALASLLGLVHQRDRLKRVRLGPHRSTKRAAIACHTSQHGTGSPRGGIPPEMLAAFDAPYEIFSQV